MSLVLRDVRKVFTSYGVETVAVERFNQTISRGQFVTLLGPSGCGKTTTLRIIAGFEVPTSGRVLLDGVDVTNMPPNKRNISMVFQSYALFPHLTVEGNIAFGLKLRGLNRRVMRAKIAEMVSLVGLEGLERRRPEQLSGGQQQRVALARSLVMEPRVLLFDEPLSNLDARLRESMRLEIRRIQQEVSITSVYVTHDQAEAMSISDLIVVMDQGKVMQIGSPFEIYARPQNSFVAAFIGRVNFLHGTVVSAQGRTVTLACEALGKALTGIPSGPLSPGDPASIVLRPESLFETKDGRPNSLRGEVLKYVFLGSHVEYELQLVAGQRVNAVMFNPVEQQLPVAGEELELFFSAESAWVIPRTS
ncbi:MAG: Putrescine transport ATP-binding protein PotA [Candidatus Bipolaricaulis sibiricus]|uniref:Putrescine transport ATP-binding protein PotA n=1 Tax=Bipolaricaulis sibiricus TaxID=2501609 RepID=A0A410FT54_BIPS1|nr:MAG: Putrescine transport ATP-binding protein PotA [Candidatus Bipolaricaulis sibiricus]